MFLTYVVWSNENCSQSIIGLTNFIVKVPATAKAKYRGLSAPAAKAPPSVEMTLLMSV